MALNHEFWRGFQEELLGRCNWEGIKETRRLQRTLGKNACQMLMAVSAKPLADAEEKPPQHKGRGTGRTTRLLLRILTTASSATAPVRLLVVFENTEEAKQACSRIIRAAEGLDIRPRTKGRQEVVFRPPWLGEDVTVWFASLYDWHQCNRDGLSAVLFDSKEV